MQKTLLDDPAARVRRWRLKRAYVAENVVSVLRQFDIELARFELTDAETTAVLNLANGEADRKLEATRRNQPSVRAAAEVVQAERAAALAVEVAASKTAYNRQHGLWGLEFDHCRSLGGIYGPWRLVYRATATAEFWDAWKKDKQMVRRLGYEPNKVGRLGLWVVERTEPAPSGVRHYPGDWCAPVEAVRPVVE